MTGSTKLMTPSGGGVILQPASSIASDVTVKVPSQSCTLGIQGPAFSAQPASGTSMSSGTWTKVVYDSEEFDTNNNFTSSRFTPTVAGYYQIIAMIYWNTTAANERVAAIYKNGSVFKWGPDIQGIANVVSGVSSLVYLNGSTDYVEIYGYSGGALTTGTSVNSPQAYFQGALVRAA